MTDEREHSDELEAASTDASAGEAADDLRKLHEFRDGGLLSAEEFDTKKADLFTGTRLL